MSHKLIIDREEEKKRSELIIEQSLNTSVRFLNSDDLVSTPQLPSNLSVDNITTTLIALTWTSSVSTDIDSYTVYVYNNTQDTLEQTITDIVLSEVEVLGLTVGEEYEFWVTTVRDNIESEESNHVTASLIDVIPYSLSFDGIDDDVIYGDVLDMNLSDRTLEFWYKLNTTDFSSKFAGIMGLVSKATAESISSQFGSWDVHVRDTGASQTIRVRFLGFNVPVTSISVDIVYDLNWHHVAVTFDRSGDLTLYFDGVSVGTLDISADSGYSMNNNKSLNLGIYSPDPGLDTHFDGLLDEIRIWNTVRTPQQIVDNANSELEGNEAGLVGYWNFNEGEGVVAEDKAGNNNGAINGATYSTNVPF